MSKSGWHKFKNRYRADEVPWRWQVPFWLWSLALTAVSTSYFLSAHLTARLRHVGRERLDPDRSYIFTLWHTHAFVYFCVFVRHRRHSWLTHPSWYMKPVHLWKHLVGIRTLLGSAGYGGRAAADELAKRLREGDSTAVNPDGPYGPWGKVKHGVLHLSRQSGAPVVPLRFDISGPCWRSGKADRKRFPLWFSKIVITYGEPVVIDGDDFSAAEAKIAAAMGDPF